MRDRLLSAVDMMEFGIALMRQNLTRRFSEAGEAETELRLQKWLFEPDRGVQLVNDTNNSRK